MEELYDKLEIDTQTYSNVDTRLLQDKATGHLRFCKTIKIEQGSGVDLSEMIDNAKFMNKIIHVNIIRYTECYIGKGDQSLHLLSNNLKNTHKPLSELTEALDEDKIVIIAEILLKVIKYVHSQNITIANLNTGNVFY